MIKVSALKASDVFKYHRLIGRVINHTYYYSLSARKKEIAGYSMKWLQAGIKNTKRILLCAKDRDKVVGFLFGYVSTGMLHLIWLGVDSNYRKVGIGQQLMLKTEAWGRGKKVHKIWFDTRVNNKQSIPLVIKLKYRKVALLKKHYYGQDFFIWEKLL